MFYRIRNHIFNLDRVVDICIKGDIIIISMDNGANGIDSGMLIDKIQKDLQTL